MIISSTARIKMINVLTADKSFTLRFGLQGGGCSGMNYFFAIDDKQEDDICIVLDSSHVLVIDPASNMYLETAEVDYKQDLMGESFVFKNSMKSSACGCGQSVSFE